MFKILFCFEFGLNLNWFYYYDVLIVLVLRMLNYLKVCFLKNKIIIKYFLINMVICVIWCMCFFNCMIINILFKVFVIREELDK